MSPDDPCVQTQSCNPATHYWDWVQCKCVLNTEPCIPKKCKTGEVWDPINCKCVGIITEPDVPVEIMS